jgi:hypothetical protein
MDAEIDMNNIISSADLYRDIPAIAGSAAARYARGLREGGDAARIGRWGGLNRVMRDE